MRARWPGIAPSTFPDSGETSPRRRNQARACRNHPKRGSAKSTCAPIWMIRHPINSGSSPDQPIRLTFGQPSCRHHHVWRHRSDQHGRSGTPLAQQARRKALREPFAVTTLRCAATQAGTTVVPARTAHARSDPGNLGIDARAERPRGDRPGRGLARAGVEPDKTSQRSGKSATRARASSALAGPQTGSQA